MVACVVSVVVVVLAFIERLLNVVVISDISFIECKDSIFVFFY